jgi:hypothetical protein
MELKDLYDLFFIAIIAIVLARWIKRRQAAQEKQRQRELDGTVLPAADARDETESRGADDASGGTPPADTAAHDAAADQPATEGDRHAPDDRAGSG